MPAPIKKRKLEVDESSTSSVSFDSPPEDDDTDESCTFADSDCEIVDTTFRAPMLDSQESQTQGSPGLGTQPPPKASTTKAKPASSKKRNISTDSLARTQSPRHKKSPRSSQSTVATLIVDKTNETEKASPTTLVSTPTHAYIGSSRQRTDSPQAPLLPGQEPPSRATENSGPKVASAKSDKKVKGHSQKLALATTEPVKIASTESATKTKTKKLATPPKRATPLKSKGTGTSKVTNPPKKPTSKETVAAKNNQTPSSSEATLTENGQKMKTGHDSSGTKGATGKLANSESKKPSTATKVSKGKKKKSFQDDLLHLLFMSCKPYTLKTLAQQMKSNEASIQFCMLSLVDKQWVVKKEFTSKGGRTKELYWANQEVKAKELYQALRMVGPRDILEAKQELAELQNKQMSVSTELTQALQEPSNDDLEKQLQALEDEVQRFEKDLNDTHTRIQGATDTQAKPAKNPLGLKGRPSLNKPKPKCMKRVKKSINTMRDEWRTRKIKCIDFVEQLADGMEKKVKDVVKILELETDESEGVKMPSKHVID